MSVLLPGYGEIVFGEPGASCTFLSLILQRSDVPQSVTQQSPGSRTHPGKEQGLPNPTPWEH